ncbi:MAG: hypothetical protein IPL61_30035 [Myxococcales bacterium]|nr:hypothetical protein [Myxococcales bacterium]
MERVQQRRAELALDLTGAVSTSTRADLEAAMASVDALLTGDLAELPGVVKNDLARWLETNRYLGLKAAAAEPTELAAAPPVELAALPEEAPLEAQPTGA